MDENLNRKILARKTAKDFVGRAGELEILLRHAGGASRHRGMLLAATPAVGLSELLRQTYDRIFNEQKIIPFYFAFSRADKNAKDCATRFLQNFLSQTVAFRRSDADLLNVSPDVCEINELAAPSDAHWIHQLTKVCARESELNDAQNFIRQALSAPLRAAANNAQVCVLLDDLQNAPAEIIERLKEIYSRSDAPFVFAGRRRFILNAVLKGHQKFPNVEILKLDRLPNADAEFLTEKLAESFDVEISEPTRDLIVRQLGAKPAFIEAILAEAHLRKRNLETFQAFEQIYTDEIFGGRIGKFYDDVFCGAAIDAEAKRKIIELLRDGSKGDAGKVSVECWRGARAFAGVDLRRVINDLHVAEVINFSSEAIFFAREDEVLNDYLESNYRLENSDEPRALIVAEALKNSLKRAPELMARAYRNASAAGLREILSVFNCQNISLGLIDYEEFKTHDKEIAAAPTISLPQIIYTASGASFYPPIERVADENRVAVAVGFEAADYRRENEIVWLAAEIESKLEAAKELTEFWCDRLEAIALICNFPKYQLWLVAPEGFAPEALEVLKQRGALGSSRKQIELLNERLKTKNLVSKDYPNEYEMILPMGEETELIAAGAVEEVAKKHHFAPKDITKIKTALVEAYINAAEHSHSPNRKIYQKLTVDDEKLTITISNRGVKLSRDKFAESVTPIEPDEGRRGWGLKLMRTLMDEVNFEQVDDGTCISMVKYLK